MTKEHLITLLNAMFSSLGFKRKGNNWVNNGDVLTKIVNLQKSNYGNRFYINYGFIIRKLKLTTHTHVWYRLAASNAESNKRFDDLLDFENDIKLEERLIELKDIISDEVIIKFKSINNEGELLDEIKRMPYSSMIPLVVKKYFNLSKWG